MYLPSAMHLRSETSDQGYLTIEGLLHAFLPPFLIKAALHRQIFITVSANCLPSALVQKYRDSLQDHVEATIAAYALQFSTLTTKMHSTLVRAQNVFGFFTTVAFCTAILTAFSVLITPQDPSASIQLRNVEV